MSEEIIQDAGGDTVKVRRYRGHLLPVFVPGAVEEMKTAPLREDDVLILSYPKCGTHWLWEICRNLQTGELLEDNVCKDSQMMETMLSEVYKGHPSPRFLNTHVRLELLPEDLLRVKPKIISVLRNPKDMAASRYNFMKKMPQFDYDGQWKNFIVSCFEGKLAYGSWFDYVKEWEDIKQKHPQLPIHTVYYEDLKQNPVSETKQISEFLGLDRSDESIAKVSEHCSFDRMKKIKKDYEISSALFRKGEVGDWKNWFTVAQNEWFDKLYQEKMKGYDFRFKYTL